MPDIPSPTRPIEALDMTLDLERLDRLGFFDLVPAAALDKVLEKLRKEPRDLPCIEGLARGLWADAEKLCEGGVTEAIGDAAALLSARGVATHVLTTPSRAADSRERIVQLYVWRTGEGWSIVEDEDLEFDCVPDRDTAVVPFVEHGTAVVRIGRTRFDMTPENGAWKDASRGFCKVIRRLLGCSVSSAESVFSFYAGANDHSIFVGTAEQARAIEHHGGPLELWPELDSDPSLHDLQLSPGRIGESDLNDVRRLQRGPPAYFDVLERHMPHSTYSHRVVYVSIGASFAAELATEIGLAPSDVYYPRDQTGQLLGYLLCRFDEPADAAEQVMKLHNRPHRGQVLIAQATPLTILQILSRAFGLERSFWA